MILVDAGVWIDHFREADPLLNAILATEDVLMHPFTLGELHLGNFKDRRRTLDSLHTLPSSALAEPIEVLQLIERERLHGRGIGYVDAHLVAAALLGYQVALWTRDKRLLAVAHELGVAFKQALH